MIDSDQSTSQAQKLLLELRKAFLQELPDKIDEMESMILRLEESVHDSENFNGLYRRVHSLKGSAGTHDINTISYICHQIEDILSDLGDDSCATHETTDLLLGYLDLIRKSIEIAAAELTDFNEIHKAMDQLRAKHQHGKISGLIIESSSFMSSLYSACLGSERIDSTTMDDGFVALGWLLKQKYDFVIMGAETKSLNGTALLYALRAAGGVNRNIKTIVITSKQKPEFIEGMQPDYVLIKDKHLTRNLSQAIQDISNKK